MKELSIQEKAKAYDEALKAAIAAHKDEDRHLKATLERIFPELKESKDERIRNQIINFIEEYGNPIHCEWQKDWIAWLEEQGEHVEINPTEFDTRLQALIGKFETLPKEELVGSLSFWLNAVQNDGTYKADEKQDKQNPCETCSSPRLNCQNFPCEKKKNFDFSNKVEPKFKVGDVIKPKDDGHEPWQIMQVDMFDKKYRFKDGCVVHFSQEDDYELIEQNSIDNIEPKFKYGDRVRNKISGLEQTLGSCIGDIYEGAFPFFIKDQDDWELVKQNPTNKNDLKKIDTFCQENCKGYQETGRCFFDEECKAKKEYMKQKHTEWNEEDEGFLNLLLAIFNNSHPNGIFTTGDIAVFNGACITSNKIINWIKSLKDKIQPKQIWNQDDKDYYDAIITKLEVTKDDAMLTDNQIEFLKSLKYKI